MRSPLVVIDHPRISRFPFLCKITKEIKVEYFFTICPVEMFNISVLIRFAGLNISYEHASRFNSGYKVTAEKLRPFIDSQDIGQSPFAA
jgi:hypothetical protein